MDVDQIGTFLEHQGFSDEAIDAYFLKHFGKKGMHWGQRTTKQKFAIVGGGIAGNMIAGRFIGQKIIVRTGRLKLAAGIGVAAIAAGAILTGKILDRHRDVPVSELPKAS